MSPRFASTKPRLFLHCANASCFSASHCLLHSISISVFHCKTTEPAYRHIQRTAPTLRSWHDAVHGKPLFVSSIEVELHPAEPHAAYCSAAPLGEPSADHMISVRQRASIPLPSLIRYPKIARVLQSSIFLMLHGKAQSFSHSLDLTYLITCF